MRATALFLVIALTGCASVVTTRQTLQGTRWTATAINGQPTPRTDSYTVSFEQDRVGGRLGCNSFGGDYRVAGNMLSLSPVAATRMACQEPHMSFEAQAFAMLRQPMRIEWHSGRNLTLSNAAGAISLERAP